MKENSAQQTFRSIGLVGAIIAGGLLVGCAPTQASSPIVESSAVQPPATSIGGAQPEGVTDFLNGVLACMQERGWSGHVVRDSIQYDAVPTDQNDQFAADSDECDQENSGTLPSPEPMSEALLRLNYERAQAAAACYDGNDVPRPTLPTFQQWRDGVFADQPFIVSSTVRMSEAEYSRAQRLCPDPYDFFFDASTKIYEEDVDYAAYARANG